MILTNTLMNSNSSSKNKMWTFVEKISICLFGITKTTNNKLRGYTVLYVLYYVSVA